VTVPRGVGRPPFEPTAEQRKIVEMLAAVGVPEDDICTVIINGKRGKPIALHTLRKHFREELACAELKANANIAGALYKTAMAGNVTAQIFWLKCRMRWRTVEHVELTGKDGADLNPAGPDLSKLSLAALRELRAAYGAPEDPQPSGD
jgi:hypothetical protein